MPNSRLNIPSVNDLLESPPLKSLMDRVSHSVVIAKARRLPRGAVASAIGGSECASSGGTGPALADWISAEQPSGIGPVINATGLLVNNELGGMPLTDRRLRPWQRKRMLTPTNN